MKRRSFLHLAGAGMAGLAAGATIPSQGRSVAAAGPRREAAVRLSAPLLKAVKFDMIEEPLSVLEKFQLLKEIGYDGVELSSPNELETAEVVEARDATDLPIHGVVDSVHWQKTLSDPDPAVRAEGLAGLETALRDASAYGATTVLLVPAVVTEDVSYAEAYERSQAQIRKALPLAEELGIRIAIENVWNRFLLSPLETARYIDEFESPWIGAYFDIGNVVNFGWPEHWIEVLGERILKLDIKEYSREVRDEEGPYAGFRVPLGEGSVDWPRVMKALASIGFEGWATAEVPGGDRDRLRDIAARMDRILARG